ncbi:MAG: bifunctional nicotinamidase/pyrazinamidase [Rhodobiaceae bacterium]|nr:bifunctional nicotinamidase/pyrazinamidase [Rhodobiaceae bacterium]
MTALNRRHVLKGMGAAAGLAAGYGSLPARAAGGIVLDDASVLLVIDVQNCFLPTGTLPVGDGDAIIPVINALGKRFENVVMTQDWHTPHHTSFASSHPGKKPFEVIELDYGPQVLWPDHCVQGTKDAELAEGLDLPQAQLIIRKGYHNAVDSYSTFMEADKATRTGLTGYLKERGLSKVYVCGLATDFCVSWSAVDATAAGFEVSVIEDATRAIDLNGSLEAAWESMIQAGVQRIQSSDFG